MYPVDPLPPPDPPSLIVAIALCILRNSSYIAAQSHWLDWQLLQDKEIINYITRKVFFVKVDDPLPHVANLYRIFDHILLI